jgi:aspergillopepsin I
MPSVSSFVTSAILAGLVAATPIEQKRGAGSFRINQIPSGTLVKNAAVSLEKTLQKYNKPIPNSVASAAAAAISGSVVATPEDSLDDAYTCPVTIGGTTFNLDFDTGSADL